MPSASTKYSYFSTLANYSFVPFFESDKPE